MERKRVRGRFVREGAEGVADGASAEGPGAAAGFLQVSLKPARLKYCRQLVNHKVAEAMPGIVDRFTTEAMQGSIDHARALAKLGSFETDEGKPVRQPRSGKSFAGRLLDELKKPKARREPF